MSHFYAFVMRVGGRIKEINGYATEAEADAFGIEETRYREFDGASEFYKE